MRASAVMCVLALAAWLGAVGAAAASTGCVLINGMSGSLADRDVVFLNPTQQIDFNVGDTITFSVSGAPGSLVNLSAGASWISLRTNGGTTSGTAVVDVDITGGARTMYIDSISNGGTATYSIGCTSAAASVVAVSPAMGMAGTAVTIDGSGFRGTTAVTFGGTPAAGFTVVNGTRISATAPAGSGTVPISVTTDAGTAGGGSFTYMTAPDAPTAVTATASDSEATVTFTPPDDNGAPISLYRVIANPGGASATGTSAPITVTGLSNGTAYTFTVTATNAAGIGVPSAASNSVTPLAPQSISFPYPGTVHFGSPVQLGVAATSGLTVQLASTTPAVCTVDGSGMMTPVSLGACTVTADQPGGGAYEPAAQVTQTFTIASANAALAVATTAIAAAVAGQAYVQDITASGGDAPYAFALVGGTLPAGLAFSSEGRLSGTATTTGSFALTVRVTDAAQQTVQRTLTLQVAATQPVASAQAVSVLAGESVTVRADAGASGGPFTTLAVTTPPPIGELKVQGMDLVYTAPAQASGTVDFDFVLGNAHATSQPARVTVTIQPRPVAPTLNATAIAGATIKVDLTAPAHGGPFTAATLVSISPAIAGIGSIENNAGGGYALNFSAAPDFAGTAQVAFTLANAHATSASGMVTIAVAARSDPSKDAQVLGVLNAQAASARRLAIGQIGNFQRRLETLRGGHAGAFRNDITLDTLSRPRGASPYSYVTRDAEERSRPVLVQPDDAVSASLPAENVGSHEATDLAVWTGGAIVFGDQRPGGHDSDIDFTTSGVSIGMDRAFGEKWSAGVGGGYGRDSSDVGQHDSRSETDAYNLAVYASYQPGERFYVDGLAGYQWLRFDARRHVTDNGATVQGRRDGTQTFASVSAGYQHRDDNLLLTSYGRLDMARASLDGYTETGDVVYALDYDRQTVETSTATLGLLAQWTLKRPYGTWAPLLRAEYGRDLHGASRATMHYADVLRAPIYQATLIDQARDHATLGAGVALQWRGGWMLRAEYQTYLDSVSGDNQSVQLGVQKRFGNP